MPGRPGWAALGSCRQDSIGSGGRCLGGARRFGGLGWGGAWLCFWGPGVVGLCTLEDGGALVYEFLLAAPAHCRAARYQTLQERKRRGSPNRGPVKPVKRVEPVNPKRPPPPGARRHERQQVAARRLVPQQYRLPAGVNAGAPCAARLRECVCVWRGGCVAAAARGGLGIRGAALRRASGPNSAPQTKAPPFSHHLPVARGVYPVVRDADVGLAEHHAPHRQVDAGGEGGGRGQHGHRACGGGWWIGCAVLCCAVLCCAVLCWAGLCWALVWCGVLCCAVACCGHKPQALAGA